MRRRLLGEVAQHARVPGIDGADGGEAHRVRLPDGHVGRALADDVADMVRTVDPRRDRRFMRDRDGPGGLAGAPDALGDRHGPREAAIGDAAQLAVDQVVHDGRDVLRREAELRHDAGQQGASVFYGNAHGRAAARS